MTDDFEIVIIELPKALREYKNNPDNKILQWMMFLDNPNDVDVIKIMKENKKIKEAKQELDKISLDEAFRRKLLNEEIYRMDMEQIKDDAHEDGLAKGEKIGMEKGKIEIAKKLLLSGMDINQVYNITGLSEDDLKKVVQNNK